MPVKHRGGQEKRRQQINRDQTVNSKTMENCINLSLTGDGENQKQPERIMAKNGDDNQRTWQRESLQAEACTTHVAGNYDHIITRFDQL